MLDTLFASTIGESLSLANVLIIVFTALALGFVISLAYMFTHRRDGWQQSYTITLIMLPAIISIIILLVGNNAARALSLAGAFSLVRFRSAPGDPKDIAYVFFTLASGLACGMGYLGYSAVFAVVMCLVMIVLDLVRYAQPKATAMALKITVPENLNYQGLFDDILSEYAVSWHLRRVKTVEFGSLFEVAFKIDLKKGCNQKEFIDKLRQRNGNLSIQLTLLEYEERAYQS